MDPIRTYVKRQFPRARYARIDTLAQGSKKHYIPVLFEADVTQARERLGELKQSTGEDVSFTGWVIKCIAQDPFFAKRVMGTVMVTAVGMFGRLQELLESDFGLDGIGERS